MESITKKDLQEAIDEAITDIISAVTKGFEDTKNDIRILEGRLDKIEQRLILVEQRLTSVEQRLDKLEMEVKDLRRAINDLKADTPSPQEFEKQEKRIARLEKAVFQF